MKTPRCLLGLALLFWGWQINLLIWGAVMAVLVEGSRFVSTRWEFSITDLKRIWNLCIVLFFGSGVILYSSEELGRVPLKLVQWLPFSFLPMMLAQAYGTIEKIPVAVFSWFLRRRPDIPLAKKTFNISFLYFGLCLLAASATNKATPFFYPAMVVLITLALMANRPARLPQPIWIGLVAGIGIAGHFGHEELHALHGNMETALARWFVGLFSRHSSLNEIRTAIGRIGRLQLSGNIVLRVEPEPGTRPPELLRDGSYDHYRGGVWNSSSNEFTQVFLETNDTVVLLPAKKLNFAVNIAGYLRGGRGPLALPVGTFEIRDLPAALQTNRLGVVRIEEGPSFLNFTAHYGPGKTRDAPPTEADLHVSRREKNTLSQIARDLGVSDESRLSERQKLETISRFFQDNFTYSLDITRSHMDPTGQKTSIEQFLTVARSGHCEYFATATVLLLREAGIPARYATGYAVDESARHGKKYLVRERDAHAWALVYRKDKDIWEEFDTTPASRSDVKEQQSSFWEPISDFFSNIKFQFSKWRWSKTSYAHYLQWLLVPLILFLVWRIIFNQQRQRAQQKKNGATTPVWPGMDSEFYKFERQMIEAGLGRRPNELFSEWKLRLSATLGKPEDLESLNRLFDLHRRLRFDPQGLTTPDRKLLQSEVARWLDVASQNSARSMAQPGSTVSDSTRG